MTKQRNASEGEKYETKVVGNDSSYCSVSYFSPSDVFHFVWFYKNEN